MNALTNADRFAPLPPPPALPSFGEADLDSLPRTFGRYRLFEQVGKGGMAQIYLARAETELGATRLVVVKQILPAFADDPRFAEMLIHEAKLAARLGHKNIAQVFDLGRAETGATSRLFIAMEYVEGFDLNALLRQCSAQKIALPAEHALGIVAEVLDGLDYAHRRIDDDGKPVGIVHRDVSPSNVLVSYDGEVKLCDFGIAHANDLVRETDHDALKGKAGYMSPEHAAGDGNAIDARADVFAAGILLWELLAGRRLYARREELSLLDQAKRAEVPRLPDRGMPKHEVLASLVAHALAKDPAERFPSAAAFRRALDEYVVEVGLISNQLVFGRWITESFGTAMVDQRRASERRLPRSTPPPRPSDRIRLPFRSTIDPNELPVLSETPATPAAVPNARADAAHLECVCDEPSSASATATRRAADAAAMAGAAEDASALDAARAQAEILEGATSSSSPIPQDDDASACHEIRPENSVPSKTGDRIVHRMPVSDGAMRAFKNELPKAAAPESLAGAAIDVSPSSSRLPASPPEESTGLSADDRATLDWARRRGVASLMFFVVMILVLLGALAWHVYR